MEQEYKVSTFGKIFYSLLAASCMVALTYALLFKIPQEHRILILLPLLLIAAGIFFLIRLFKSKVILLNDRMIRVTAFYKKELLFNEIKGYHIVPQEIVIEHLTKKELNIKIARYQNLANHNDLINWLGVKFTDLNKIDLSAEKEEMLSGLTSDNEKEERCKRLKTSRQIANVYDLGAFLTGAAVLFLDSKTWLVMAFIYPVLGVLLLRLSSGFIKLITNNYKSIYPGIILGFSVPIAAVSITSLFYYDVISYRNALLPSA